MPSPVPAKPNKASPGTRKSQGMPEGQWGLDLWSGEAWFSDWFYQRLSWRTQVKRKRLDDLRPHLSADGWQTLLLGVRAHLEQQIPLQLVVQVQVRPGELERWQIKGCVERNAGGQPVHLNGTAREESTKLSADNRPGTP